MMSTTYFSLPIELYTNLQSILHQNGIETIDISINCDYGPFSEGYIQEVKQGKQKTLLIEIDGSPQFLHCSTIDFPESYEATLHLGYPVNKRYLEILELLEPVLLRYGGKRL